MSSAYLRTLSLRDDSVDITNALNGFMAERQAAVDLQNEALNNYDQEMLAIGDVKEDDG